MKTFCVATFLLCLIFAGCSDSSHDLISTAKQLDAYANAHDMDGFARLLSDDAVLKAPDATMHNGKDSVRAWLSTLMPGFHVDSYGYEQSGDTVTWMSVARSDAFASMGINPMGINATAVFANGKLRFFSPEPNQQSVGKLRFAQFYAEVVNGGSVDAIDKFVAEDMTEHSAVPPSMPKGRAGVKAYFTMIREAFPDLHAKPTLFLADGDYVLVAATWSGTNKGKFMGKPASNKMLSWSVADVIRLVNGKAVEHWAWDNMMEQMAMQKGK